MDTQTRHGHARIRHLPTYATAENRTRDRLLSKRMRKPLGHGGRQRKDSLNRRKTCFMKFDMY